MCLGFNIILFKSHNTDSILLKYIFFSLYLHRYLHRVSLVISLVFSESSENFKRHIKLKWDSYVVSQRYAHPFSI